MRHILLSLTLLAFFAVGVAAQDLPRVTAELENAETIVGQPLVMRIKVLVPTWLPQPPEFPSLDLPGLLVRLPERASGPVSERVGSETWSGVQRAYRLYPLQPGRFDIPAQTLRVTYAMPDAIDPISENVALEPITFTATVPTAARGLSPLIVASGFSLDSTVERVEQLAVGGAIVRTIVAKVSGTTPILIPQLTPDPIGMSLRAYPDEPSVTDTEDRAVLSGTRTERTTYLATTAGQAQLPAVSINWFNLETGQVETAQVPAVTLSIAPGDAAGRDGQFWTWRNILSVVVAALISGGVLRAIWPSVASSARSQRNRWRASEHYACRQVLKAIRARDLGATYAALEVWARSHPELAISDLRSALVQVGQKHSARTKSPRDANGWNAIRKSFLSSRRASIHAERHSESRQDLKPLNPDWHAGT